MDTYDQMQITVRGDGITSIIFRMDEGYDGFSFYADTEKLVAFLRGEKGAPDVLRDIFRVAVRFMERVSFCDLSDLCSHRDVRPRQEVEAYNMTLPFVVAKKLAERIENEHLVLELDTTDGAPTEAVIELSKQERVEWLEQHGIGKGKVRVEFSNDDVKNKFEAKVAEYADLAGMLPPADKLLAANSWARCLETLTNIARNTTQSRDEVGILRIGPDWAGFTFSAGGLFGGLIFHESSGEWSVHT